MNTVMKKKCLKNILSFLMTVMLLPSAAFAGETDTNVQSALCSEITDLYHLGIISDVPDADFRPDDLITRSEFAGWLAGAGNLHGGSESISFSDVSADDSNIDSIRSLAEAGIMVGNGDGTFSPDKAILTEEALKSVLVLLGYTPYAEAAGGYYDGYIQTGYDKELLDGIKNGKGGSLTRSDAAKLIYNALFTNVMEPSGSNANGIVFGEKYDKTLIYRSYKIIKAEGIVEANSISDIEGGEGIAAGYVQISGEVYKDGTDKSTDLLGKKTEFYYTDNDPYEIVYIKNGKRTASVIVNSADIDDYINNTLRYYDGSKLSSYKVSAMADVIYNGKVLDYSKNDILFRDENGTQTHYGNIELFDNDGDGKYDVLNIHAYHNMIISTVRTLDSETGKKPESEWFEIIDKNGISIKIDPEKRCSIRNIDGSEIQWTELAENDVLAMAQSRDGQNIEMILCTDVVTGEITNLSNEGNSGKYIVTVDSKQYEIRQSTGFYCIDQTAESIGLTVGDKAFFTLDLSGRIALVKDKSVNAGPVYGLIINYLISDDGNGVLIKLMNANGDVELVPAAERVKIDGTNYKGITQLMQKLSEVSKNLNGVSKSGEALRKEFLINYKTNKDGEIILIDTPYLYEPEKNEDEQTLHVMKLNENVSESVSLLFRSNTFGGKIVIDSSTLFFYIPPAESANDSSAYALIPSGQLQIDENHLIKAYNSNLQKQIPEAVVIYSTPTYTKNVSVISKGTDIGICLEKSIALDQDENARDSISIFQNGHVIKKCVEMEDEEVYDALVPGDVIRFGTKENANINTINVVYKFDENKLPREGLENSPYIKNSNRLFTDSGSRAIFGGVYSKENNVIAVVNQIKKYQDNDIDISYDGGILVNDDMSDLSVKAQSSIERYDISKYQLYRFNADTETIDTVTASDILAYQQTQSKYDYALIFTIDYRPGIVILYSMDDVKWNY